MRCVSFKSLSILALVLIVITVSAFPAAAQTLSLNLGDAAGAGPGGGSVTGRIVQLLALMTVLAIAPSILMIATSFTRIVIVLSLLRSAIGVQQVPPNTVMISLALFLTGFIMAPTIERSYNEGLKPLIAQQIDETAAFPKITGPFQDFMLKHVREHDLELFVNLSKTGPYATPKDIPLHILAPSFIISELRRGFEIGFLLFIPFIIIDMVVASILMAMGMMMLPPVTISMPFKIIFFVLVDGWYLICGSLVQSYG